MRTIFDGWRGGVVPVDFQDTLSAANRISAMPMSPVLAASLAVANAFEFVRDQTATVGHFPVGLSLWDPSTVNWLDEKTDGPSLSILPSSLWILGLGHVGQAYLSCLGLLPYDAADTLSLVLQDVDTIVHRRKARRS
jgi:hypothetical protein